MTRASSLPSGTQIGRVSLLASDRSELVEFYRDVVGLKVCSQSSGETTLGAGGRTLLVIGEDQNAAPRDRAKAGLYHTAFRVPSRAALSDALRRIRAQWELESASDHDVSEALYLTDPAGNGVEIYRDRPRDRWSTSGGHVEMGSNPLDLESLLAASSDQPEGERIVVEDVIDPETTVGHVHLEVSAIDDARAFYEDGIGFDIAVEPAPSVLFFAAGGYHHHVAVNTWNRRSAPASGQGVAWFEITVPDGSALTAVCDRVRATGGTLSEHDDGFDVTDPDGIEVRVRLENGT
ncbi:VOC family protein [Halostagnicola bangensis]